MSNLTTPGGICSPGYIKVDFPVPPYYIYVPTTSPTVARSPTAAVTSPLTDNCYTTYAPVLPVHNTQIPAIYPTLAFTFDIYKTPVSVPKFVVKHRTRKKAPERLEIPSSTILTVLGIFHVDTA
ncbi:TVG0290017 [Thermoplasma volcanium GSS1]|uniref:TVG0290017 protein n=1 Tax=Thermoplasma volcanium (strain ATCC 51530 / DSM 4299 / JCM 9571 / NBRC 15438 / GSS1) TaxID=273116 RepID=Q97C28_THEVO|nr:hypothetical protein [Thermoplasma volcanium]BAB59419.1 TVG0290017 [Thermoplasma volcanium GSS1]